MSINLAKERLRLRHEWDGSGADLVLEVTPDQPATPTSIAVSERLLRSYRASVAQSSPMTSGSVWDGIAQHVQGDYLDLLDHGSPTEMADYLGRMYRTTATHGTCQGAWEHGQIALDERYRRLKAAQFKSVLLAFVERSGALPVENPEQSAWGSSMKIPLAQLMTHARRALGVPFAPPAVDGGLYRLPTPKGGFHERDVYAAETAYALRSLTGDRPAFTIEIGGGVGKAAYWNVLSGGASARLPGVPLPGGPAPKKPVHGIVDLPHILVLQGFALAAAGASFATAIEIEAGMEAEVLLVPPNKRDLLTAFRPEVFVNVDSLPEIPAAEAREYVRWMTTMGRSALLSINHETRPLVQAPNVRQNRVADLFASANARRTDRRLSWTRGGYVEEIYRW